MPDGSPPDGSPPDARDPLSVEQIKARALGGAMTLGVRGAAVLGLGVVCNLVLARLLVPRDLGLFALGTTVILFAHILADAGLGATLIRRPRAPTRRELEAVLGVQLLLATALSLVLAAAASAFGREGLVLALMVACLPLATLRLPTSLVLERELAYRAIATAEVIEAVTAYAWAIATVAAGWGVWGLASSVPVRVLVGSLVMIRLGTIGFVRPRVDWRLVRPIVGFGARFQAIKAVTAGRDQSLNAGIAAVAGIATLGLWGLAFRIMQLPLTLVFSLARVSYATLSRLRAKEDPRPLIERGIGVVAVILSPLLVGIAVGGQTLLIPIVGDKWGAVPDALAWSSLAMIVSAPVWVWAFGYLLAAGEANRLLVAALVQAAVWVAVALPLLAPAGVSAVGIGWVAASLVELCLLSVWLGRASKARVLRSFARPAGVAITAGAAGLWLSHLGGEDVVTGLVDLAAAELLLGLMLLGLAGEPLRAALRMIRGGIAGAGGG